MLNAELIVERVVERGFHQHLRFGVVMVSLAMLCGCGAMDDVEATDDDADPLPTEPQETPDLGTLTGQQLYAEPLPGTPTTFACATCHALSDPAGDEVRRPGHEIGSAALRSSFKNGQLSELRQAVNSCLQDWMGTDPWEEDDVPWGNLREFLTTQSQGRAASDLSFAIVSPPADLTGGDYEEGRALFNGSCSICHGVDGAGSPRGPNVSGSRLTPERIAERIRLSGPTESSVYDQVTGGRMPFWSAERLTDDELRDLIVFLKESEAVMTPPGQEFVEDADLGLDISPPDAQTNCGSTHPRVGQTATLSEKSHDVAGTARIVDDCTIQITGFHYDGDGIDVRMYSGVGGNYRSGRAISRDIYRPGQPFTDVSVFMRLPHGMTLDDLDGISVWCVAVAISFGDGQFE